MSEHRYPLSATAADTARGAAGAALTATPLVVADPPLWLAGALLCAVLLFVGFSGGALLRTRRRWRLDDEGLRCASRALAWSDLSELRLRYYSTRRDRRGGWLELYLRSRSSVVRLDSRVRGFDAVLARAVHAARSQRLALSDATRANLCALGVDPGPCEAQR